MEDFLRGAGSRVPVRLHVHLRSGLDADELVLLGGRVVVVGVVVVAVVDDVQRAHAAVRQVAIGVEAREVPRYRADYLVRLLREVDYRRILVQVRLMLYVTRLKGVILQPVRLYGGSASARRGDHVLVGDADARAGGVLRVGRGNRVAHDLDVVARRELFLHHRRVD